MARPTKTEKRKIVNQVFTLVRKGHSLTEARQLTSNDVGFSANTLGNWQTKLNMKTPIVSTKLVETTHAVVPVQLTIDPTIITGKQQLSRIMTSHYRQDGEYADKEVSAMCKLATGILAYNKHELEVAKFVNKSIIKRGAVKV